MLVLLVRGGTVVDGTGAPARTADVGVRDGRVVAVGRVDETARRTVDADGLVVAPGVIDLHTHYDAQLCWDPYATPSVLHGVTTVIGGNCGFSLAPSEPEGHDYLTRVFARVEGIPHPTLVDGVPWDWRSFADYLDRLEGRLGVNAGFFVGHTALRRLVLRDDIERVASPDELDAMLHHLHSSLAAGGLGLSTSLVQSDNDDQGRPVASRFAARGELVDLARATGEHDGTTLEIVPPFGPFSDDYMDLMTAMSVAADRPINWNVMNVSVAIEELIAQRLSASDYAAERGGCVVGLVMPDTNAMRLNLVSGLLFDALPGFDLLMELPVRERIAVLDSPARLLLRRSAESQVGRSLYYITDWGGLRVGETFSPANEGLAGRLVRDIAAERGADPFDALCDVVVADELRTMLVTPFRGDDDTSWKLREATVRDGRTIVGGSDSGAHLDMLDTFTMSTRLLGPVRRERKIARLEEAVHMLTGMPASFYGIADRGAVREGCWADLFVFDPERVDSGPVYTSHDLPADGSRLYADAVGVHHVFVNGQQVVEGAELVDARPGRTIRSGRDTRTVTAAEGLSRQWRSGVDAPRSGG